MARIAQDEIERLKREISIAEVVSASGVKLERQGTNLVGRCPGHADKTPSLIVTPDKGLWHCMGACQKGGTVVEWTMWREGVSFRHAIALLEKGAGATPRKSSEPPPKRTTLRKLPALAHGEESDEELLGRVVELYHETLKESSEARAYLASRGLENAEAIEHFKLGYSNRSLAYRLPHSQSDAGGALRGRLVELGVYRQSGHELLSGSLVIPLYDEAGNVVNLYGRKVQDHQREGTPKHLYLPGSHRGVFNRAALEGSDEVILCEALIDALTFWCAGYRNVTSAYGIEGFTQELADALVAAKVKRVKIAFDCDEAGERGAQKVGAKLEALGMEIYRVVFPKGMDANEYARKVAPAKKSLGLVLRQATWMGRGERPAAETDSTAIAEVTPQPAASGEFPSLAASAVLETPSQAAPATTSAPAIERQGSDTFFVFDERKWRARDVGKGAGELRNNLLVSQETPGGGFFVDTVDLYSARQRAVFAKLASDELGVDEGAIRRELGVMVLELERIRDEQAAPAAPATEAAPAMSEEDREEAMTLLRDPKLLDRILEDLARAGVVGEETNKLISYLAATSRKLEEPLAIVIQSSSAAGKSSLMEAVLALMPEEERVQYSAMTGQSLFYMSGQNLKHKILAIVEEEGAERASYALKLLQSEGELTIASTGKDPATGRLVTQTYRVEGPVMIILTTTSPDVDEELLNRCMVLSVDERRRQTRAIHDRQRESQTLEGFLAREERQRIRRLHKNAQRLLKPVMVVNPFARELDFADHATRARRDHMKYLTMIRAVTLLHQHQRPVKTTEYRGRTLEYIEATREDVALGTRLAQAVLPRGFDDLPPQTRRLLELLGEMVKEHMEREKVTQTEVRLTRRQVREWTKWGQTQLRLHLERLEEHEYVIVHRFGRGSRLQLYELADPGAGQTYDRTSSGVGATSSGVHRGVIAPISAHHRGSNGAANGSKKALAAILPLNGANHA